MEILSALVDSKNTKDLFALIAKELREREFVKDGYYQALLEREATYPTGLSFNGDFKIAIPHTGMEFTKKEVLVVVKMHEGAIPFHKMDNPDETIDVKTAFFFAIKDSKKYIQFLSDFIEVLKDIQCQKKIIELSPKKIVATLGDALPQYNFVYEGFLV